MKMKILRYGVDLSLFSDTYSDIVILIFPEALKNKHH